MHCTSAFMESSQHNLKYLEVVFYFTVSGKLMNVHKELSNPPATVAPNPTEKLWPVNTNQV